MYIDSEIISIGIQTFYGHIYYSFSAEKNIESALLNIKRVDRTEIDVNDRTEIIRNEEIKPIGNVCMILINQL